MKIKTTSTFTIKCSREDFVLLRNVIRHRRVTGDTGRSFWAAETNERFEQMDKELSAALEGT